MLTTHPGAQVMPGWLTEDVGLNFERRGRRLGNIVAPIQVSVLYRVSRRLQSRRHSILSSLRTREPLRYITVLGESRLNIS